MEKLLTVQEAAERLRISPGTLYHWLSQGKLTFVRFSARCVRFRESDLSALVNERGIPNADHIEQARKKGKNNT